MRPLFAVVGWVAAIVGAVGGVLLSVNAQRWAMEAIGVATAGIGGTMLVALLRCRRFETVVNRRFVETAAGPFTKRLPVGFVDRAELRSATGWRRLYADREVVLTSPTGTQPLVVPTGDPEGLTAVFQDVNETIY